jgi:hypothetical protein
MARKKEIKKDRRKRVIDFLNAGGSVRDLAVVKVNKKS